MSDTYASFSQALAYYMAVPNGDVDEPNFAAILPSIIDYAEQRCYFDLDLLNLTLGEWFAASAGLRNMTYLASSYYAPSMASAPPQLRTIESVEISNPGVIFPLTATPSMTQCVPASRDFLDAAFLGGITPNSAAPRGRPIYYAPETDTTVLFGPTPDMNYLVRIVGKIDYTPLYDTAPDDGTQTTILTSLFPALFINCAMVNASGYQKNFSASSDNPQQPINWEQQYQALLAESKILALRQRQHGWQQIGADRAPPPMPPGTPSPPP